MEKINDLVTPKEFQKYIGSSLAFIYKLAKTGRVPVARIPRLADDLNVRIKEKHLIRFKWKDILIFIDSHYQNSKED